MSQPDQIFTVSSNQPFDSLGLFTFLRTYARRHDEADPYSSVESWSECLTRVVNACNTQLNVNFSYDEKQEFFNLLYNLKCSVAGRFLWQLGTRTVDKLGLMSLQNCAFTVIDGPVKPFVWIMNFLMLGAGCGYRILQSDIDKFPNVMNSKIERMDTKDADFIVPDTRQGWLKLLGKVLKSHFYSGQGFTYSCHLLRSKGAPIKGFGGLSSGPEVLCDGVHKINDMLNKRVGGKITTVDALDIANIIGMIVVSGNVRRSAQIAIGDVKDTAYMQAKRWDLGPIPNWRCYSNNSVICNDINDIIDDEGFWAGYNGSGEPYGLINMNLSKSCGRLGETEYLDPDVEGYNPCAEQNLNRWETCCLGEIYLPNISTYSELEKCATYIYRVCKHSLSLPCSDSKDTETIVHKNYRMGIGITGYLQATEEQRGWLSNCYKYLREYDVNYSKLNGFPPSIKLTTCKPSGCSKGDSHILTSSGLLCLDEIGNTTGSKWQNVSGMYAFTDYSSDNVSSDNAPKYKQLEKIAKFYINGFAQTKKIKTEHGFIIESTLTHRYRVLDSNGYSWKYVGDLEPNDKLLVKIGEYVEPSFRARLVTVPDKTNEMFQPLYVEDFDIVSNIQTIHKYYDHQLTHSFRFPKHEQELTGLLLNLGLGHVMTFQDNIVHVQSKVFIDWITSNKFNLDRVPLVIRQSKLPTIVKYLVNNKQGRVLSTTHCHNLAQSMASLFRAIGYNVRISHVIDMYEISENTTSVIDEWNNFLIDPVKFVEDGMCETFDIEVENAHHYRLNGCISHNTLSILGHCTSGVHPGFAQYYIRRIRVSSESNLIQLAKEHGYPTEYVQNFDGSLDFSTHVISFPYMLPEGTILAENCTAVQQLEFVKRLQSDWSDNSVSVTVYYKKEELNDIKEWLKHNYNNSIKTVSFLLHSDHGFKQAPLEKITKEEYEIMASMTRPITVQSQYRHTSDDEKFVGEGECAGGACPLK